MGGRFRDEARSLNFNWKAVKRLKERYGNTLTTTLWHLVCERNPEEPVFGMVSRHPHHPHIGMRADGADVACFFRSNAFRAQFANINEGHAFTALTSYANRNQRGPIGEDVHPFIDVNGDVYDFRMYTFSNTYDLLTYGVCLDRHRQVVGF